MHVHYIDDQIIAHSHPFSPKTDHQHSTNDIQLIQQISHFNSIEASFGLQLVIFAACLIFLLAEKTQKNRLNKYRRRLLCRPPPVFC